MPLPGRILAISVCPRRVVRRFELALQHLRATPEKFTFRDESNPADRGLLLQEMRDNLRRIGVSMPRGFDSDRRNHQIFREVHVIVGTSSSVFVNKKGELAWHMADPRDMDTEIARLLKE